ncbi:hypothetical protein MKEN_01383100 [Mycena kentingensis (nom. inval.)]|nr:hypothetical protein MKEN_01383100 [Mycena kentingensis (nom. inval.)]
MPRPIKLPVVPPSFHVLGELPLDVGLGIFSLCSPFDLVQLAATSKSNRTLILTHESLWESAHNNLARGECPRLPTRPIVETSGNYSQEAYVLWVFGGGPCSQCSKPTTSLPFKFLFRFRACSTPCSRILMSRQHVHYCSPAEFKALPYSIGLPHIAREEPSTEIYIYTSLKFVTNAKHEATAAKQFNNRGYRPPASSTFKRRSQAELDAEYTRRERSRPAVEKNADDLQTWRDLYNAQHAVVAAANNDFITRMAKEERVNPSRLGRTPTLKRLKHAFDRDLELLTPSVWSHNLSTIVDELGPKRVVCQHCGKTYDEDRLSAHLSDCQDAQLGTMFGWNKQKALCQQCPESRRLYTKDGLEDHRVAQHGLVRSVIAWKRCPLCPDRFRVFKSQEGRMKHDNDVHNSGPPARGPSRDGK